MKILAVADEESAALWDYYEPEKFQGVDLILSAGDVKAEYLEFLVTMTNLPLLYIRGNHDDCYKTNYTIIKVSASWGSAAPCITIPAKICTRNRK